MKAFGDFHVWTDEGLLAPLCGCKNIPYSCLVSQAFSKLIRPTQIKGDCDENRAQTGCREVFTPYKGNVLLLFLPFVDSKRPVHTWPSSWWAVHESSFHKIWYAASVKLLKEQYQNYSWPSKKKKKILSLSTAQMGICWILAINETMWPLTPSIPGDGRMPYWRHHIYFVHGNLFSLTAHTTTWATMSVSPVRRQVSPRSHLIKATATRQFDLI